MNGLNCKTFQSIIINNQKVNVLFGLISDSNTRKAIDYLVSYFRKEFYFVDADNEQDLATKYNIRIIPTLLMFDNAQVINSVEGTESIRDYVMPKS